MPQRMSCEFKVSAVPGAVRWWRKWSTSATTTRVALTVHISHRGTHDRARSYVTGPEGNQCGWHVCFPVLDLGDQPYSGHTSISHSTLTEVSEMTVAWTSSRRKTPACRS